MVELKAKAVDAAYPLLGRIELVAPEQLHALLADRDGVWGAVAEPALIAKLGLVHGDRLGGNRGLMRFEWAPQPSVIATTVLLGVVITLTLGSAGTWRRLGRGAGAFLRND